MPCRVSSWPGVVLSSSPSDTPTEERSAAIIIARPAAARTHAPARIQREPGTRFSKARSPTTPAASRSARPQ